MRNFGDRIPRPRRDASGAAMAMLFPELAAVPGVRLEEGLLRAPPRGRTPPPLLSALVAEGPAGGASAGIATPGGILAERGWEDRTLLARAAAARRALAAARIGGAWWHGGDGTRLPPGDGLAVVDLVAAERGAAPDAAVAAAMLDRATAEHPAQRLIVLAAGLAGGRLSAGLASNAARGATVLGAAIDPWLMLPRAKRVYSAGGEFGFLALIAGVPVTAFGEAFYAGWSVTDDAPGLPQHGFRRTVDELFAAACLLATRYRDPFRNTATSFEEALAILADWRRLDDANRGVAVCVGMSFWKRRRIADFLRSSAGGPVFRRTAADALAATRRGPGPPGAIAGWASRLPDGLAAAAARHGVRLIRVEDGFIRSVGLGSDFLPPASLVCDARGMYFDPRQPSDLETLLAETEFAPALLARAQRLAGQLVSRGVTKYNLAAGAAELDLPAGRRCILVPGQVEDDLSITCGGGAVRTNRDLLAAVRAANPDACILYKPHPDVAAGHRQGAVPDTTARRFADLFVGSAATAALLAVVDEVHTMTSLAGFEALLRGRRVVVYGRPFYAGWGLTVDQLPIDRGRRLTLDELVAGALILYPRYLDPLTRLPCGPELIIERLDQPGLWRPGPLVLARRLQGMIARRLSEVRAVLPIVGAPPARGLSERPRP